MTELSLDARTYIRLFVATLLAVVISLWLFTCSALAEQRDEELSPAENWVLEQVKAGKVADLEERFPDERDRVLSADFIEELLTSKPEDALVHRHGVRIEHAIFTEPLDLVNADVLYETRLDNCRFENKVDLARSHFHRVLSFWGSEFNDKADFKLMTVGDTAYFENAVFEGAVDFRYVDIAVNFEANEARFKYSKERANFVHMTVGKVAFFRRAVFEGPADFRYAQIGGNFDANGARFNNADKEANFSNMKVGGAALFNPLNSTKAVFAGPVDFGHAQIDGNFEAKGAQFTNLGKEANFGSMKVGGSALFNNALFAGRVRFRSADIGVDFEANGAQFTNRYEEANFGAMKVGGAALFNPSNSTKAVFAGPVDFRYADIAVNFEANEAQFTNPEKEANFAAMKVGYTAFISNTIFMGPVDFRHAQIGGGFQANGARFTNPDKEAYFGHMKVGGLALFNNALFAGPVGFRSADIAADFEAREAQFNKNANFGSMKVGHTAFFKKAVFAGPAVFSYAQIGGNFEASGAWFRKETNFHVMKVTGDALFNPSNSTKAVFAGPVDFRYAKIGGGFNASEAQFNDTEKGADFTGMTAGVTAFFNKAVFEGLVNLTGAQFLDLEIQERRKWLTDPESIRLDGMTYQHINAKDETWRELLNWVDGSAYSTQPYVQLEAFFRAEGHPERADAVFVARKHRERGEALGGACSLAWWANLFLQVFVLYGVRPQYALVWSSFVVLFGCLWFHRENMEPQKAEDASQSYYPFWYSLDLFLPINLRMANAWRPRHDRRVARHYARVHTILGWILIPIGLAAVSGIIK